MVMTGSKMSISQIMEKMIAYSNGNLRDITHFTCVWNYARMIGELEKLDPATQFILEVGAITHDIACPLCRLKYGHADFKCQEPEGTVLAEEFLEDTGMSRDQIERVKYLVGHHHTLTGIDGADLQILIEADYIVNAAEKGYSKQSIENFIQKIFRTEPGKRIAASVFLL